MSEEMAKPEQVFELKPGCMYCVRFSYHVPADRIDRFVNYCKLLGIIIVVAYCQPGDIEFLPVQGEKSE